MKGLHTTVGVDNAMQHARLLKPAASWLVKIAVSDVDGPVMASFRQVQSVVAWRRTSGVFSQTWSGYNEGFI